VGCKRNDKAATRPNQWERVAAKIGDYRAKDELFDSAAFSVPALFF
jgi:hypothetical protein